MCDWRAWRDLVDKRAVGLQNLAGEVPGGEGHTAIAEEGDEYALYVHEGYWTQSGKLVRYIVDKNELDNLV